MSAELPDEEKLTGRLVILGAAARLLTAVALVDGWNILYLWLGLWGLQGCIATVVAFHADRIIAHVHLAKEYGDG